MSRIGKTAARAQNSLSEVETALERTQTALAAAERADMVASKAARKSGKFFKLILILGVIGAIAFVVKKKMDSTSDSPPGNPDPYGSGSTEE